MRKSISFFVGFVLFVSLTLMTGCKREKTAQQPVLTDYEQTMTNQDTLAVTQLVDRFFGFIENDQLAEAVAMLYKMNEEDVYQEPQLLDNEQMQKVMNAYRPFLPIRSHRIDYIKFYSAHDNEVKVTAIMEEATADRPEMTTVFYFKPYDYMTNWRLCTFSSDDGNRRIISNAETDSMQQRYSEELEQKKAK